MDKVGGIAAILGQQFAFPVDAGYGLVQLGERWAIVKFSCPLESLPPKGDGYVITSHDDGISIREGLMFYGGHHLHLGVAQ